MKFKVDENLGETFAQSLRDAGHDAISVQGQRVQGMSDPELLALCTREDRCLVTLDHDFADVLTFPPKLAAGIVVWRVVSSRQNADRLACQQAFLSALGDHDLRGKLWVVRPDRVREHVDDFEDDELEEQS